MNVAERAYILCFQIKGMNRIGGDHDKIPGFTEYFPGIDVHRAAAGAYQVNLNRAMDMPGKTVAVFTELIFGADDSLGVKKDFTLAWMGTVV